MSHSVVLVTNTHIRAVDEQLRRFNEQGDDGDDFMEKEIEIGYDGYAAALADLAQIYDGYAKKALESEEPSKAEEYTQKAKKYRDADATNVEQAQELLKQYHGGVWDSQGNLYYLTNNDARWDWYEVGGRWSGFFIAKPEVPLDKLTTNTHFSEGAKEMRERLAQHRTDVIKVKDIDWQAMTDLERKRKELAWEEAKTVDDQEKRWRFGILPETTYEDYVKVENPSTFAVLHNDEWYERGQMGWWGMVKDEKPEGEWEREFRKLLDSLDGEAEVTIVDVHI